MGLYKPKKQKQKSMAQKKKKVCIIGAGVSGLATCKYLLQRGIEPVIFEANEKIGGVWTSTTASTRLQASTAVYQFSDFTWPNELKEKFPGSKYVMEYLESYANRFDLMRCVRFGAKVEGIEYVGVGEDEIEAWDRWGSDGGGGGSAFGDGRGVWRVKVQSEGVSQVHEMDFVILCLGRYSGLPNIPILPINKGPEVFNGEVMHYMEYSKLDNTKAIEFIRGKRVTVVGYLRAALDIATECAKINGLEYPCTMIVRTKRWNIPKFDIMGISFSFFCLSRFSELLIHKPGEGLISSLVATMLSPLRWMISKFVERELKKNVPMKMFNMVPEHSFLEGLASGFICLMPEKFGEKVKEGSIILKQSKKFEFCEKGVIIEGQTTPIKSDLVIYATGFKGDQKIRDIFISPWFKKIVAGSEDMSVPLYRQCIHPDIPQMAIIGYSESISTLYVSEMRARWLACFLDNGFILPNKIKMKMDIMEWDKFFKKYAGKSSRCYRKCNISLIRHWYNDQLCKDMGCNPKRKNGFFADLFIPYTPTDYAQLELKNN